jgi:hypothetical protein
MWTEKCEIQRIGWRLRSSLSGVTAAAGGISAEVLFPGAQGDFTGLESNQSVLAAKLERTRQWNEIADRAANSASINIE